MTSNTAIQDEKTSRFTVFRPRVDLIDSDNAITLIADMPGVDEQSAEVTLDQNVLTIRGKVNPQRREGYSVTRKEFDVGHFERAFTLSEKIDRGNIDATVRNGVLTVHLPKATEMLSKQVEIKSK